ncbi:MAG TPA: hypothetical protein VGM39_20340 [Kofleriaceae bacterium]
MKSCLFLVASALACAALCACGDGGGFADAMPAEGPPPDGTVSVKWSVTDANGAPITCDSVGAQVVTLVLHNKAVSGGSTEAFVCGTGQGTTPPYAPGTYDISFELDGPSGIIETAPVQTIDIKSNQNAELQPISFAVDASGALDLTLTALDSPSNCTGGAGIQSEKITLTKNSDNSCAALAAGGAITLAISAGSSGGTAQTYAINCTTPAVTTGCLQADQHLTVTGVASGSYTIHVRATTTTAGECYVNDDSLTVKALGATTTTGLNLSKQMSACSF